MIKPIKVSCSACGIELCEIITIKDNKNVKWNLVAECPECGDLGYCPNFTGYFSIGDSQTCTVVDIQTDADKDLIKVKVKKL